jgi:hypothetical protein
VGAAAAAEMLALNQRTINPVSGTFLAATWLLAGALAGAALGALGGRGWTALRLRADDGAAFLATIGVGHLLLPLGAAPAAALAALVARLLRRRLLPRHGRLDRGVLLALLFVVADRAMPGAASLPPALPAGAGLDDGLPAPGAMPVTVSVHPRSPFPEVPAVHVPLSPLSSDPPGLRAALLTGRLPARTGAGPSAPRALPFGGGIARVPSRRASRALASIFPRIARLEGTPFEAAGTLPELVEAAGVPVLTTLPAPGDPPLFLRWLEVDAAPPREVAERLGDGGLWIDVTEDPVAGGRLAFAGAGAARRPFPGDAALVDVAPTALHVLGLAVPRDCDGRVLLERLDAAGPGSRPPRYRPLAPPPPARNAARKRGPRATLRKRGSERTASKRGSVRQRSGSDAPAAAAASSRAAASATSPREAASAAPRKRPSP